MKKFIILFREPDGRTTNTFRPCDPGTPGKLEKMVFNGGAERKFERRKRNAADFGEAIEIMKTCPIYEFGGYVEIRELQNQN